MHGCRGVIMAFGVLPAAAEAGTMFTAAAKGTGMSAKPVTIRGVTPLEMAVRADAVKERGIGLSLAWPLAYPRWLLPDQVLALRCVFPHQGGEIGYTVRRFRRSVEGSRVVTLFSSGALAALFDALGLADPGRHYRTILPAGQADADGVRLLQMLGAPSAPLAEWKPLGEILDIK